VLDLSERNVRQLAREGKMPKAKHGEYDLIACVQGYIRHLRAVAAGHKSEDSKLDLTEERARLAKEQADAQELENAVSREELVPATVVEGSAWRSMTRTSATDCDSRDLPGDFPVDRLR
jgi:terminase small subunit / prophage DNA-packing protein